MASVDWTDYVDLTPYDVSAVDLFEDAISYAQQTLPAWVPEAGNIEVVVTEAVATIAARVIAAANRVPGAVVETLLKLFDIDRSDGIKATGTVSITAVDSVGYTVPAGTAVSYFPVDGTQPLTYILDNDVTIAAGSTTGTSTVTAQVVGTAHNKPSTGARLQVLATMPYVLSTSFSVAPSGGADAESDDEFFDRAVTTLASYSSALVTENQISTYVLTNYPTVHRCKTYSRRRSADRDTTDGDYTTHDGYALVVLTKENDDINDTSDVSLTASELQEIEDDLEDRTVSSLEVELANAQLISIDVSASFNVLPTYLTSAVEDAVTAALQNYLNPNTWDWDSVVRANEIVVLIDQVPGVDYVSSVALDLNGGETNATDDGTNITMHLLGSLPVIDDIALTSTQV